MSYRHRGALVRRRLCASFISSRPWCLIDTSMLSLTVHGVEPLVDVLNRTSYNTLSWRGFPNPHRHSTSSSSPTLVLRPSPPVPCPLLHLVFPPQATVATLRPVAAKGSRLNRGALVEYPAEHRSVQCLVGDIGCQMGVDHSLKNI